jgi:glycosyltransferase involved in cell wall biosynthesis
MGMQVDHVSFSSTGGAGRVARDIVTSQQEAGLDATFTHLIDFDLVREPFRYPNVSMAALVDEYLLSNGSSDTLTSFARGKISNVRRMKVREKSIVNLHWTEGVFTPKDLKELESAGHKMVWTMHDMRPFTGFCHHSHNCEGYAKDCRKCPQVRRVFQPVIAGNFKERARLIPRPEALKVVAPSEWMKSILGKSAMFVDHEVEVIPNPLAKAFLNKQNKIEVRHELGLPGSSFIGISVAEQLESEGKKVLDTINAFFATTSALGIEAHYIIVGNGGERLAGHPGVVHLSARSSEGVAQAIAASDVLLNMSVAESSGMTVLEAAALGIPSVARRVGGLNESIVDGVTGFTCLDFKELEPALIQLISDPSKVAQFGERARKQSLERNSPSVVADSYLHLYQSFR